MSVGKRGRGAKALRASGLLVGAALVASLSFVHADYLAGRRLYFNDSNVAFTNVYLLLDPVLRLELPTWSPEMNCGEPVWPLAEIEPGFDPVALACFGAAKLFHRPPALAYQWTCVGWLLVFALGGALLSRRVCRDPWISLSVFILLFYGPVAFELAAQSQGGILPHRWVPWALVAFLSFDRSPSLRSAIVWGAVTALSFGGYQTGYALFFESVFMAIYVVSARRLRAAAIPRRLALTGVAVAVATLSAAPLLATARKLLSLVPIARLCSPGFNYSFSFGQLVHDFLETPVPLNAWYGTTDVGSLPAALALFAVASELVGLLPRTSDLRGRALLRGRRIERAWTGATVVTALATTDTLIHLAPIGRDGTFLGLRNWGFMLPLVLLGITQLFAAGYRRLGRVAGGRAFVGALLVAALSVELWGGRLPGGRTLALPAAVLLGSLACAVAGKLGRSPPRSTVLSVLVAALVALHVGREAVHQRFSISPALLARSPSFHDSPPRPAARRNEFFWIADHEPFHYQGPTVFREPSAIMEGPGVPTGTYRFLDGGWVVSPPYPVPRTFATHQVRLPRYHELVNRAGRLDQDVLLGALGVSLPVFRLAAGAIRVDGPGEALDTLAHMAGTSALASTVVVEAREVPLAVPSKAPPEAAGSWKLLEATATRFAVEVELSANAVALHSENLDPDWTATLDGAPVEIFPANVYAKAVFVPRGRHTVVFEYRPLLYEVCFFTRLAAWALLPLAIFLTRRRSRSPP
jgi:hypothetical protein